MKEYLFIDNEGYCIVAIIRAFDSDIKFITKMKKVMEHPEQYSLKDYMKGKYGFTEMEYDASYTRYLTLAN